jgi:archaellum component FlaF (FlaF/FlaG flagellin family)
MRRGLWLEVCWYAVLACVAIVANFVSGAELYVAPGGSDTRARDAAAPWLTLQYAADAVGPGNRVVIVQATTKASSSMSRAVGGPIEFIAEPRSQR